MAFKKIEREYLVTDDSVNVYGFRLLTSGYLQDKFKANPIGYRMHERKDGVVLKWEDFRTDGDKVYAKPVINLSNPLGQQTAEEVENGFLNAASVGKIVVVEFSDDPKLMLPNQTGPTVTKWYHKELSLVDIPGNENALAPLLFDEQDNEINLADFIQSSLKKMPGQGLFKTSLNNDSMDFKTLVIKGLNLSDNTSDAAATLALNDLIARADKLPKLEKDLTDAVNAKVTAEKNLKDYKAEATKKEVQDLLDGAMEAGKATREMCDKLAVSYEGKPKELKDLLDSMPAHQSITKKIKDGAVNDLADKTWEELDKADKLSDLKESDFELFKTKYKQKFNTDYKE